MVTAGPIERGVVYPLPEFMRRTGFTKSTMRSARRQGLAVKRVGKFSFVDGDSFVEFVASNGRTVGANGELTDLTEVAS